MRLSGDEALYPVCQYTRGVCGEQAGASAESSHREAQQDEPDRCIGGEMLGVRVLPNSSENSPPLAMTDRCGVQNASGLQFGFGSQPREEYQEYDP